MEKDKIRCPICKNKVNSLELYSITGKRAIFIAECWSGNVTLGRKDKPRHIFIVQMNNLPKVVIE